MCVSKLNSIGSDNGLLPGRRQAIIWINVRMMSICTWGTHFNEISSEIHTFSFTKMHLKMLCVKWQQFCPCPIVLTHWGLNEMADVWEITLSNAYSLIKKGWISIKISPKFLAEGMIGNKSVLSHVMAWCHTSGELLPEPMLTKTSDAIWHH